jgi:hypothetical protein
LLERADERRVIALVFHPAGVQENDHSSQ